MKILYISRGIPEETRVSLKAKITPWSLAAERYISAKHLGGECQLCIH